MNAVRLSLPLILVGLGLSPSLSSAQQAAPDIEALRKAVQKQGERLEAQQKALEVEKKRVRQYEQELAESRRQLNELRRQLGLSPKVPLQAASFGPEPAAPASAAAAPPAPGVRPGVDSPSGSPEITPPGGPVGKAPARPQGPQTTELARVFEQPGVLTQRGRFVLEPSLQFSHSSSDRIVLAGLTVIPAIVVGAIDVRRVSRDTAIAALTTRYGVNNRFEVEAKIPYVYRNDDSVNRRFLDQAFRDELFTADGMGLGDIELAARYQLNRGAPDRPYYIGSVRLKTRTGKDMFEVEYPPEANSVTGLFPTELPTGSGFYGVQPSLTVIYPADPAVFYAGVNYLWNIERDINQTIGNVRFGTVDPGDAVGVNVGMGFAINEKAAFSLGYDHSVIGKFKNDGIASVIATETQVASFLVGYSYRFNKQWGLNLSTSAGLTEDAPDTQITVRIPYSFR